MLKKWRKNRKVSSIFIVYSTIIIIISMILVGVVYSLMEIWDFNREAEQDRIDYFENQKTLVKNEIEKLFDYIELSRRFVQNNTEQNLLVKTNGAYQIINSIYQSNQNLSDNQIKKHIKDALRPIRFNNGRGYIFIMTMDGISELSPINSNLEGKNLINLQDDLDNFVVKQEIELIKEKGEGFVIGHWTKPELNSGMVFKKKSYIKYFEPFNWYIGCGEYLDDVEKDIQTEILKKIKEIKFGDEGYIFANTYDGYALVIDSDELKEGENIWEMTDPNGVKVIQIEREAVRNPDGDYIQYSWKRFSSSKISPKISFMKGIDDWEWMVGAGVYFDDIENIIIRERKLLFKNLQKRLIITFILLIFVILIEYLIAKRISKNLDKNFSIFTNRLERAVSSGYLLKKENYSLKDIKLAVPIINSIIQEKLDILKSLTESEIRFRTVFKNVPVMIAIIDEKNNYQLYNNEIKQNFDFNKDGKEISIQSFLTENVLNNNFNKAIINGDGIFRELEVKTKDGVKNQNWAIFKTEMNELIMVGYDITEMKMTQQNLKELMDVKDKFFSIISHDLHSPFNTIIGFSEIMIRKHETLSDKEKIKYLQIINDSSVGMHKLLLNLLSWVRAQSGKIEIKKEKIYLHHIIADVINIVFPQAELKSIRINNTVNENVFVLADASLVFTVIQNLIANGIKFTHNGGEITISVELESDCAQVLVKDTGIGISEQDLSRLFKIDEGLKKPGTNEEKGTGLGLLLCKEFVEKNGGKIWAKSKVGEGSSFYFTLNLSEK